MRSRSRGRGAKSKRMKYSRKVNDPGISTSETESDEGPNEEEEIDFAINENNEDEDDPLNLFTSNNENGNTKVNNDYGYYDKSVKSQKEPRREHRIKLRQDLFPSPIKTRSNAESAQKVDKNLRIARKILSANNKKKSIHTNITSKGNPSCDTKARDPLVSLIPYVKINLGAETSPSLATISKTKSPTKDKNACLMYVQKDQQNFILPATQVLKNNTLQNQCEKQQISKKVTRAQGNKNRSRSNTVEKETIVIEDDPVPAPNILPAANKPVLLKKLLPKEVPKQIKRARQVIAPTLVPTNSSLDKRISVGVLSGPTVESNINISPQKQTKNSKISEAINSTVENTNKKISDTFPIETITIDDVEEFPSSTTESPSKKTFVLMKLKADEVPEEIKRATLLLTEKSSEQAPLQINSTLLDKKQNSLTANDTSTQLKSITSESTSKSTTMFKPILGNVLSLLSSSKGLTPRLTLPNFNNTKSGKNTQQISSVTPGNVNKTKGTFLVADVRLSSLVNSSQTSKTGSTSSPVAVVNQTDISPSTSNTLNTKNKEDTGNNRMSRVLVDMEASSSDDEPCEEELGLNSLEELQDLWVLIDELYTFNKQTIRSLQTKKKRFQQRIKAVESLLLEALEMRKKSFSHAVPPSIESDDLSTEVKPKEE